MRLHATLFSAFALVALSAFPLERTGKVELVPVDLSKRVATVAWTWTELADRSVRLMVSRNGDDFPTDGWGGFLFMGDGVLGGAVAGTAGGYNELVFDVGKVSVPTNGKYTVQIVATNETGRIEEWVRGTLTVRANPSASGMPADWDYYADLASKVAPYIDAEGILTNPENADALWGAVSNKTDALIQAVSPTPDFTTNNQTLVDTIVAKAPPPDLSGVVHGDDRAADKEAFTNNGIKLRATDDDGGNLRLRIGDPSGVGLRWYSDSTGTSLAKPYFALTYLGITHPTDEGAEDFTLTTWDDFTKAQHVRDVMPDRNDTANRKYPISGGAFLDYFWGLNSLPTGAVQKLEGQITPNAASNLVRSSGALIGADGIMDGAAMLTATSAIPFYTFSPWRTDWPEDDPAQPTPPVWTNGSWAVWVVDGALSDGPFTVAGREGDTNLLYTLYGYPTAFWRVKSYGGDTNTYGLARMKDIAPTVSNTVTKAYVEDLGIESGIQEESDPIWLADKGGYAKTGAVNAVSAIVAAWDGYWSGSNVIFEVTNYYGNTSGELPRLRIKELMASGEYAGTYRTVWDEANKFQVCESNLLAAVSESNLACRAACAADLSDSLASRAPLAWGTVTDKGTTNVVGNSVWMTSPETYFAGGTEYQRVAVGSGTICVLADNGAGTYTAGEAGTFRFQDEGGTNYFGFAKSDSYTIGCNTDGITVSSNLVTLRYDVIMGGTDVPIVYWRLSLSSGEWTQLNNADGTAANGAPYTVTWYTSGGSYYAAINCGSNASGFFKAETSVVGDVVFETNMKARLGGGIECTNTATGVMGVIRPTYNGSSVTWTWSAR